MFNVKLTKTGSLAVIFPNTDESKRTILSLLSMVLSNPDNTGSLSLPGDTKTLLTDSQKYETAMKAKTEHRKATDASYVYEELSPDERMMEDQRYEINAAIIEFAREIGKEVTPSNLGGYFTQFYALLRKSTGYFPSRKTLLTYHNPYVATKINTVLVDGKGADLLRVINTEIRSLHKRSTRPQLSLRLNS